ncbi:Protein EXORDIUM [Dichanthelium oligosanthes]|uniref:Protein EXORDIUM n=1 Tax=Dichanthelium oligosanthes TaxID=888268 RepID=A0A1E5UYR9_9POAL|nr:Protein EXORDIUM [Dichanthelium oligosanthes]
MGARRRMELYQPNPADMLSYHNGQVLHGDIAVSILWYGQFTQVQKTIVYDFLLSLTMMPQAASPSVAQWWNTIDQQYLSKAVPATPNAGGEAKMTEVLLANQESDDNYSMGKSLTLAQISDLAARANPKKGGVALVFTAQDVTVEGFCMSQCGLHGSDAKAGTTYVWVGNSATQCPGECAWPFHQPEYGPQDPALRPPNGDVGLDGMIVNLATELAGVVTNPFGDAYYQGSSDAPLEAATACPGQFGSGSYPGYAGNLKTDQASVKDHTHFVAMVSRVLVAAMVLMSLAQLSMGSRRLMELYVPPKSDQLTYHHGTVLSGDIPVSILWYGKFTPAQRSIATDFLLSLTTAPSAATPSVGQWWGTIDQLYLSSTAATNGAASATRVLLDAQASDEACSLGRSLTLAQVEQLAARAGGGKKDGIALVFTDEDVAVEGFCSSRCGKHGSAPGAQSTYIWVGNSVKQCPGQCAWPFAQPQYGPQGAPLVAPNGDVGMDGLVMVLATMVAGTVTNPYGDAFYQGPRDAPLEACTACPGVYGSGAYPGFPGNLLVDQTTGASYNANGVSGRKYLLPALYNPATSTCSTLV